MGHSICAIIGKRPVDEDNLKKYQLALAYEGDFAIVILDQDSVWYWAEKLQLNIQSQSENIEWACELSFHFAKELGLKKYAIIQTDYSGGTGAQSASLYEEGQLVMGDKPINDILRLIGVEKTKDKDEFDAINLGGYRDSEYYYWDSNNWADAKPNMIAGRIPKDNS